MPPVSTAMAKNVVRRALLQLVDPSPDKYQAALIWDYFESRCAYCDRSLTRGAKEGHIDHLVSASAGGRNHLANRVLACATCNEKEKRDADWRAFLEQKCSDSEIRQTRIARIETWLNLQKAKGNPVDPALIAAAEEAAQEIAVAFNEKVKALKARLPKKPGAVRVKALERRMPPDRTGEPLVKARYEASRLTFKRDIIEPLAGTDAFRVDTPDGSFVMTKAEFYAEFPGVVASQSYQRGLYNYSVTPQRAYAYIVPATTRFSFDQIVDALVRAKRRATYGAVAGVLGRPPRSLMVGKPKDARHSWIVSSASGLPTGYEADHIAPGLASSPEPIADARELVKFLRSAG